MEFSEIDDALDLLKEALDAIKTELSAPMVDSSSMTPEKRAYRVRKNSRLPREGTRLMLAYLTMLDMGGTWNADRLADALANEGSPGTMDSAQMIMCRLNELGLVRRRYRGGYTVVDILP